MMAIEEKTPVELPGVRCQGVAESTGRRCRSRCYALIRLVNPETGAWREEWLCGNHQRIEKRKGLVVHLVRKWRAG